MKTPVVQIPRLLCAALAIAGLLASSVTARAINVTPTSSATTLIDTIKGPSITLLGTPTLTGGPYSAATFTNGLPTGIGIDSGIILSSGDTRLITNSNTSGTTGSDFGGAGDSSLSLLSNCTTYDATVLSFDFKTTTGNLYFNFAFASDEYNEWTNSAYNDVFAFFVNGNNIALIPSTTTPISINTVNGGNPFGYNASNPQYFRNNESGQYPFEFDGMTRVFTVSAMNLDVNATHTMKLAIADSSDHFYDSAVFIQAGSLDENEHEHDVETAPDNETTFVLLFGALLLVAFFRRRTV